MNTDNMKTRTISELLQLMLDSEYLFETGLCKLNRELILRKLINHTEYSMLVDYLKAKLPHPNYVDPSPIFWNLIHRYSFPYGKFPPRKRWLQEQIESLNGRAHIHYVPHV